MRLRSLAQLGAIALLSAIFPLVAQKALATSPELSPEKQSIEIPVPPPDTTQRGLCPDFLDASIDSIIQSPTFRGGRWGILVEPLSSKTPLYRHNADEFLIPASNIKLLTTAAALQTPSIQEPSAFSSLREWIRIINLTSNNRYADVLLNRIGGPSAVRQLLTPMGINPNSYRQVDGSGLSRYNMATPSAFVTVLKAMQQDEEGDIFVASLPVAGVSGTLENRFRNTPVQGELRAKTGTLQGVRALSGFLQHPDYDVLVFSILVNQPNQSGQTLISAIDQIVLRLNQLTVCDQ